MKKIVLCAISIGCISASYADSKNSLENQLAYLKDQVRILQNQVEAITVNKESAVKKDVAAEPCTKTCNIAPSLAAPVRDKYWHIPGTSTQMSISGFVKLTCTKDVAGSTALAGDASGAGRNFLVARSIGLDGVANVPSRDFYMHMRESRLLFNTITPVDGTDFSTCIEFDFLGDPTGSALVANNYNLRLRRAYLQFGGLLIGQDWSTCVDMATFGETVDRNGPVGHTQIRQPMIRYTTKKYGDYKFSFALENPESEFITAPGRMVSSSSSSSNNSFIDGVKGENHWPDIIAAVDYTRPWGNVKLIGVVRENSVLRAANHSRDRQVGGFLSGTLACNLFEKDLAVLHIAYGSGAGRYFHDSMKAATYYDGNKLYNQYAFQASFCYKHLWQEAYKLRSSVCFGYLRNLNCDALKQALRTNGAITDDNRTYLNRHVMSLHANIMANINDRTQVGLEYVVGRRKAENGASGKLHRFVLAMQVSF